MIEKYIKEINILFGLLFIIILIFLLFVNEYNKSSFSYTTYYAVVDDASGIKKNQSIVIGGYPVGHVKSIYLNDELRAVLEIVIESDIKIPEDSFLNVTSLSLFASAKTIAVGDGISDQYLDSDDVIYNVSIGLDLNQVLDLISYYLQHKLN